MEIDRVEVDGVILMGLKANLPEAPPLVMLIGGRGFVMCAYLNIESAERLGIAAAYVSCVRSFDDILNAQIKGATTKAKSLGLETGKRVRDVIGHLA